MSWVNRRKLRLIDGIAGGVSRSVLASAQLLGLLYRGLVDVYWCASQVYLA